MEAIVMSVVLEAAKRLGLSADSRIVSEAVQTAVLAVQDGRTIELACELGKSALVRGVQLAAA